MNSNFQPVLSNGELYHHGILGQKWGVRRFQNPDGTLTEEGRKRYSKSIERGTRFHNSEKSGDTWKRPYLAVAQRGMIRQLVLDAARMIDKSSTFRTALATSLVTAGVSPAAAAGIVAANEIFSKYAHVGLSALNAAYTARTARDVHNAKKFNKKNLRKGIQREFTEKDFDY